MASSVGVPARAGIASIIDFAKAAMNGRIPIASDDTFCLNGNHMISGDSKTHRLASSNDCL